MKPLLLESVIVEWRVAIMTKVLKVDDMAAIASLEVNLDDVVTIAGPSPNEVEVLIPLLRGVRLNAVMIVYRKGADLKDVMKLREQVIGRLAGREIVPRETIEEDGDMPISCVECKSLVREPGDNDSAHDNGQYVCGENGVYIGPRQADVTRVITKRRFRGCPKDDISRETIDEELVECACCHRMVEGVCEVAQGFCETCYNIMIQKGIISIDKCSVDGCVVVVEYLPGNPFGDMCRDCFEGILSEVKEVAEGNNEDNVPRETIGGE